MDKKSTVAILLLCLIPLISGCKKISANPMALDLPPGFSSWEEYNENLFQIFNKKEKKIILPFCDQVEYGGCRRRGWEIREIK